MGYASSILQRDVSAEKTALQKRGRKKSLWGSIGRTLGGIAATVLTGGVAAPWAVGLAAGAGTFAGGALGSQWAGKIGEGKFFQGERESLEKELGVFGEANVVGGLKAAVTAGMGQKLQLMKDAKAAKLLDPKMTDEAFKTLSRGKGFDFAASPLSRGWQKGRTSLFDAYTDRKLSGI